MNDTHDSGSSVPLCEWKKAHPEYLVGNRNSNFPYGCNRWSSVNYALQEVRDKVYRILHDTCSRYNIDGIEYQVHKDRLTKQEIEAITIKTEKKKSKKPTNSKENVIA